MTNPFENPPTLDNKGEAGFTPEEEARLRELSVDPEASDDLKRTLLEADRAPEGGEKEGSQFTFRPEDIERVLRRLVPDENERKALTREKKDELIRAEEMRIRASQDENLEQAA